MSGVVKGVKKAFKAIGNAVKKVLKKPDLQGYAFGCCGDLHQGAAAAAFGAMGSGAGLGAAITAGINRRVSLGSAVGAVTGAFQGLTGLGSTAASAAPIVERRRRYRCRCRNIGRMGFRRRSGRDTVAAVGGAAEGGAMAGGLAEGVGGLVGPSAELAGGFVRAPADLAGGGFQLMPTASNSALANAASGGTFARNRFPD